MNGNSQAVRIPQEFRLDTDRVEIFRNVDGDLVLHPAPVNRGDALLSALNAFDDQDLVCFVLAHSEQLPMQDREKIGRKLGSDSNLPFDVYQATAIE